MEPVQIAIIIVQWAVLIALSPLFTGIIGKLKALMQSRRGASIFQPYYDLYKLFRKESVVSRNASWVFHVTPYVCMASVLIAALLVPVFIAISFSFFGDLVVFIYILAISRFFMALAALDTGSAFGRHGQQQGDDHLLHGRAHDATIDIRHGADREHDQPQRHLQAARRIGPGPGAAFIIPCLRGIFYCNARGEPRIPVDNPSTHLELTMIHEAMVLEY